MNKFNLKNLLVLGVSILLIACSSNEKKVISKDTIVQESKKANAFFETEYQEDLNRNPEDQTYLGIKTNADKWNDYSDDFAAEELQHQKLSLQWLKDSINLAALDSDTRLSYDLYKARLENQISDYEFRLYNYPVNQMHGMQAEVPAFLINMHQIIDVKDAENYIARLNAMKPLFDQLVINLKSRQEVGIMIPKFVFAKVIEDSKNVITGAPFDNSNRNSTLLEDFSSKVIALEIDDAQKQALIDKAVDGLLNGVLPAYNHLIATLEDQEKVATNEDGAWKFPNGKAYFNNALKRTTTTNLTSDEIHQLGLSEVSRIHDEMRTIKNSVGFEGDLKAFFRFMKVDPQFYFEDSDEGRVVYMQEATQIIDSMQTRLDELFITKPKAAMKVKAVEPFREKSAGKAFYQDAAPDGSRPGTYYANMYDMASMPSYQMEALAYHEGIPGHHMQLSIAQELTSIPKFRKFGSYTAYIEGWGLYSEFIPKEMGFYADPYSDFGRLAMELWRACRLVVDTGIHTKKWTREEGIKYYTDNTPNAELDAIKMVERHIVMPSQATAYKIGMLKILELREEAKEKLGDKFDIRKFHEVILSNGALPLDVLEDLVNQWVAEELNG